MGGDAVVVGEAGAADGTRTLLVAGEPVRASEDHVVVAVERAKAARTIGRARGALADLEGRGSAKRGKAGRERSALASRGLSEVVALGDAARRPRPHGVSSSSRGSAMPGVRIHIGHATLDVDEVMDGVRFSLDPELRTPHMGTEPSMKLEQLTAGDLMVKDVVTVARHDSIRQAARLMTEHNDPLSRPLVPEAPAPRPGSGRTIEAIVVQVLCEGDLRVVDRLGSGDVLSEPAICVQRDAALLDCLRFMRNAGVRSAPVHHATTSDRRPHASPTRRPRAGDGGAVTRPM